MNYLEKIYRLLNHEDKMIVTKGIHYEAVPFIYKNYFLLIISSMLTKLGDVLSAPKTVITWLMTYIGAPVFLTSLLVPIRESGSMLPQIILKRLLNNVSKRKSWWIVGSLIQSFSLICIVLSGLFLDGYVAGIIIVLMVGVFSLGRALCSLLSKDVIGKTIPKTRRGKLNGYSSSLSGVLVLFSGIILLFHPIEKATEPALLALISIAAVLWILSALVFNQIYEPIIQQNKEKNTPPFWILIKKDRVLQKFILARGLLISSALMSPFVILLSQEYIGTDLYILGLFILSGGIASVASGPFWGYMADRSSKMVMVTAASIVSMVAIAVIFLLFSKSSIINNLWLYPLLIFVLAIAHDGIRLGRKTYIIDIAEGEMRTQYVATSNTAIGILLLFVGVFTAWLGSLSLLLAIVVLTVMVVAGIWFSFKLPEALGR